MYKKIDETIERIEGFEYSNKFGAIERVKFLHDTVVFEDDEGDELRAFYLDDIPKLIKALQAAYDYKKGSVK